MMELYSEVYALEFFEVASTYQEVCSFRFSYFSV